MAKFLLAVVVVLLIGAAHAQNDTTAAPDVTTAAPVDTTTAAPVETTTAAPVETTTAAPVETTAAPTTEAPSVVADEGGLTVTCNQDYMEVILDISRHNSLSLDGISLEDKNCKLATSNSTHITFKTDLDKCDTKHNTTDDEIIYYNAILANTQGGRSHPIISRKFQATFPFQCSFPRRQILSVTSFSPRRKVVYVRAAENGNFTFTMDMYKSDQYAEAVANYPHVVNLGQKLFFRTEVKSKDSELVLFIQNARATPSDDINDPINFMFIENGCSKDNTLDYKYDNTSSVQQFGIDAFRFITSNKPNVYIHAELVVCRQNEKDSVCARGCETSKRRRRRSVGEAPGAALYVGPLQVSQAHAVGSASSSVGTIGAIAGALGALVLILIVALAVLYQRRGASPSTKVVFTKASQEESNRLV